MHHLTWSMSTSRRIQGDFEIMEFEYQRNWMSGSFNFKVPACEFFQSRVLTSVQELRSRILLIKEKLVCSIICTRYASFKLLIQVKELVQWQREGVESSKHQSFACQHILSAFEVLDTKHIACMSLAYCTDHIYVFQKWSKLSNVGISAAPREFNKFVWDVTIMGDLDGGW